MTDRTTTPPNPAGTIELDHLMPGADLLRAGTLQLAIGFPEEVVKAWMRAGRSPNAWLIPDRRTHDGVVQWALEFPLYFALFIRGSFARGEKLAVLVSERDWPDVCEYLRLTLLGLTRDELRAAGVAPAVGEMLAQEGDYLALKHADGRIAQVTDFLEPHLFDADGVVELGGLRVRRHGDNTYSFFTADDRLEEYRLEVDGAQVPPYARPLPQASAPMLAQPFEVVTLGTTNGFDPGGPCANTLVQANGRFLLVDCGPYIRTLLGHAGVSLNQLSALVLTHAHEDHAVGLSALLSLAHRITLFCSRENAEVMRRKLALLNPEVKSPATLLDDAFDLVYVEPGQTYDFLGLELRFHYTMHSIPCTGVELSMRDGDTVRKVLLVGDNNSRANIEKAANAGVMSQSRLDELLALYAWRGDLVVFDGGAGLIHGMPADFGQNGSTQVVCVHTGTLKAEEQHLYTLAEPGHRYTIVAEHARPTPLERGLGHKALCDAYPEASVDWITAVLDAASPVSVNRGHVVVRHQDRSADVFVILAGELMVLVERDGKPHPVATLQAGEIFGEMAAVNDAPRSASVRALTPARLLRVPGELFRRFARQANLTAALPDLWRKRADLDRVPMLAEASVTTRSLLARHAVRRTIEPGATLIREGSASSTVFVLIAGRVQVYKGSEPLLVAGAPVIVEPATLIGETAPFLKAARNASIVAIDACEVLAIRGADFKRIVQRSPQLFCAISQIVKQRSAA